MRECNAVLFIFTSRTSFLCCRSLLNLMIGKLKSNSPTLTKAESKFVKTPAVHEMVSKQPDRNRSGSEALQRRTERQLIWFCMGGIVSGNYLRATSSHFAVCAAHQAILSFARHIKQTRVILRHSKLPSTLH